MVKTRSSTVSVTIETRAHAPLSLSICDKNKRHTTVHPTVDTGRTKKKRRLHYPPGCVHLPKKRTLLANNYRPSALRDARVEEAGYEAVQDAAVPRSRVPSGSRLFQGAPEVGLHEEQRRDRPGEDPESGGPGRLRHQGAGGSVLPPEIQSHEEEVLRPRKEIIKAHMEEAAG